MRESRTLGSVRAKAEWLSYSTIPLLRQPHDSNNEVGHRILCQNSALLK